MLKNEKNPDELKLPSVIDSQIVFEESIIKIKKDRLRIDHTPPYNYYTLMTRPASVIIIATTPEGKFVLNQEYRHPVAKILLCFPGGFIDEGEEVLKAAERELMEETGYQAEAYQVIGSAYPYPGISSQKIYYIHCINAVFKSPPQPEASEIFQVNLISFNELNKEISNGIDVDGTLCSALFFLNRKKDL
jgi:ADP-ribose pyrophosphatase